MGITIQTVRQLSTLTSKCRSFLHSLVLQHFLFVLTCSWTCIHSLHHRLQWQPQVGIHHVCCFLLVMLFTSVLNQCHLPPRTRETSWTTTLASQRKPTTTRPLYMHRWTHMLWTQGLGPIKTQDPREQSVCWWNGLEWSQLGMGKHADSLALITEALNLSSTHTKTDKRHTNTQTETQTRSLSSETEAGLNYRPPDREYWLKNGVVVGIGQFLLLKIPTSENGQASLCNKRARNASIKRFKRDLNRLFPGPAHS